MPKLSVLVMAYNVEKYVAEALDSILMQEVDFSYDIHIGNDGSTDGTVNILQVYANKYPDIVKLHITGRTPRDGSGDYVNFHNMFSTAMTIGSIRKSYKNKSTFWMPIPISRSADIITFFCGKMADSKRRTPII